MSLGIWGDGETRIGVFVFSGSFSYTVNKTRARDKMTDATALEPGDWLEAMEGPGGSEFLRLGPPG